MSKEDTPGYMYDEVAKLCSDIECNTIEEVEEYWQSDGGQHFEELAMDLIRMYMKAKDEDLQ